VSSLLLNTRRGFLRKNTRIAYVYTHASIAFTFSQTGKIICTIWFPREKSMKIAIGLPRNHQRSRDVSPTFLGEKRYLAPYVFGITQREPRGVAENNAAGNFGKSATAEMDSRELSVGYGSRAGAKGQAIGQRRERFAKRRLARSLRDSYEVISSAGVSSLSPKSEVCSSAEIWRQILKSAGRSPCTQPFARIRQRVTLDGIAIESKKR